MGKGADGAAAMTSSSKAAEVTRMPELTTAKATTNNAVWRHAAAPSHSVLTTPPMTLFATRTMMQVATEPSSPRLGRTTGELYRSHNYIRPATTPNPGRALSPAALAALAAAPEAGGASIFSATSPRRKAIKQADPVFPINSFWVDSTLTPTIAQSDASCALVLRGDAGAWDGGGEDAPAPGSAPPMTPSRPPPATASALARQRGAPHGDTPRPPSRGVAASLAPPRRPPAGGALSGAAFGSGGTALAVSPGALSAATRSKHFSVDRVCPVGSILFDSNLTPSLSPRASAAFHSARRTKSPRAAAHTPKFTSAI